MEIRVLKYFLMTAREENITKAAALLHLTQPTLSRQLIQLEEELGVTLFHRNRHRIVLTEDGMLLRRRAEEIVSLAEKTKDDFRHRQEHLAGTISIGSGELKSSRFLTRLITDFQKENPLVTFTIYSGNSDNIKERIERGFWTWACCRSRWTSPDTVLSAHRSEKSGVFWCVKILLWHLRAAFHRRIWPVCR